MAFPTTPSDTESTNTAIVNLPGLSQDCEL
jgi:hypothetical protein